MEEPPCPPRARIVREAGGWSVFVPGLPVAADGASLDAAVTGWSMPSGSTRRIGGDACTTPRTAFLATGLRHHRRDRAPVGRTRPAREAGPRPGQPRRNSLLPNHTTGS